MTDWNFDLNFVPVNGKCEVRATTLGALNLEASSNLVLGFQELFLP